MINVGDYITFTDKDFSVKNTFEIKGVSYNLRKQTICISYMGRYNMKSFVFNYEGNIEYNELLLVNNDTYIYISYAIDQGRWR